MNCFKKIFSGVALSALLLTGCHSNVNHNTIKVGTISGPETDLVQVAKAVADQKYGLNVQIIEFSDYTLPDTALSDGSLDANIFQHQPYLDSAIKDKNYQLVAIGKTFVYPMGIYSKNIKDLKLLPNSAVVAIPNDPSNEARALLLLQKAGLITLKPNVGVNATIIDIIKNPKNLKIKEIDAAQLTRVLPDVSLAVINTNYAVPAGLYPSKDALFTEDKNSAYANLIVVRTQDTNNPKLKELVESMHSAEVIEAAKHLFKGQAIQAW